MSNGNLGKIWVKMKKELKSEFCKFSKINVELWGIEPQTF